MSRDLYSIDNRLHAIRVIMDAIYRMKSRRVKVKRNKKKKERESGTRGQR